MYNAAQGVIAQLVEHLNGIEGVSGSNPLSSIPWNSHRQKTSFLLELLSIIKQMCCQIEKLSYQVSLLPTSLQLS